MIAIVNYGLGNLGSIFNMLKRVGAAGTVSSDAAVIEKAEKLILPGVGSFDAAMQRLNESGLRPVLDELVVARRVPLLGICLGMQLLTESSEEGTLPGLGWFRARTLAFKGRIAHHMKVPHIGWNTVMVTRASALTIGLPDESRFYFVHSYYVSVDNEEDSILKATYGISYDAAIQHGNIYGAQFHPEKSHKFGMQLLTNFARL
jgi:glutamine amidotransferase